MSPVNKTSSFVHKNYYDVLTVDPVGQGGENTVKKAKKHQRNKVHQVATKTVQTETTAPALKLTQRAPKKAESGILSTMVKMGVIALAISAGVKPLTLPAIEAPRPMSLNNCSIITKDHIFGGTSVINDYIPHSALVVAGPLKDHNYGPAFTVKIPEDMAQKIRQEKSKQDNQDTISNVFGLAISGVFCAAQFPGACATFGKIAGIL